MAEWGKLYGSLHGSPKWRRASKGAKALWTTANSWCIDQEASDGVVPSDMLRLLGGTKLEANTLTSVGLWDEIDGGWRFHDWAERQRTKDEVDRDRESARERQRRSRARREDASRRDSRVTDRDGHSVSHAVSHAARGEERRVEERREERLGRADATPRTDAKKGSRIPNPFPVTPEMVEWARKEVPGLDHRAVTDRFIDYWAAIPGSKGVKLDWIATWRNWMRREGDGGGGGMGATPAPAGPSLWDKAAKHG